MGFTGRLSNSTRGFPFPASTRTTWRAASRFVLSYCRGLSRRCVLTTAARPAHDPSTVPVPSGIRQFRLFRSLPPFSFARSFNAFIALVTVERKRDTRIAQRKIAQEFNSTLNSLRPEMRCADVTKRFRCVNDSRSEIEYQFFFFFFFLCKIIRDYMEIKLIEKHFFSRMSSNIEVNYLSREREARYIIS